MNILLEPWLRNYRLGLPEILEHGFFLRNFSAVELSFLPESWSLAIEEWFYLLFPAALFLGLRLSRRFDAVFVTTSVVFLLFSIAILTFSLQFAGSILLSALLYHFYKAPWTRLRERAAPAIAALVDRKTKRAAT